MKIAFYKGWRGNWLDILICIFTFGAYSHCELVVDERCYSSSPRDGGVRHKKFAISDKWIIIDLPEMTERQKDNFYLYFANTIGKKYDYLGIFASFFLGLKWGNPDKYFCSEWCAEVLNYVYQFDIDVYSSPSRLKRHLEYYYL